MKKKIILLLIVIALIVSVFGACSKSKVKETSVNSSSTAVPQNNNPQEPDEGNDEFPEKHTLEKITAVDCSDKYLYVSSEHSGIYYEKTNGLYGIISPDGMKDTDAIYTYIDYVNDMAFAVSALPDGAELTVENMNTMGLTDIYAEEIVPMEYAYFESLSDNYVLAYKATEITNNLDEAVLSETSRNFATIPYDNDTYFKAQWFVIDVRTGKPVDGVSGDGLPSLYVDDDYFGNYIEYRNADSELVYVNSNGALLPDGAEFIGNGYYKIETGDKGTVFDPDDIKLFEYKPDEYTVVAACDDSCFIAEKYAGNTSYILLDKAGRIVSVEFENYPVVYGICVEIDNRLFDFQGKELVDFEYDVIEFDETTKKAYVLATEENEHTDEFIIITDKCEILADFRNSSVASVGYSDFIPLRIGENGEELCYSYKDKDFIFSGTPSGHNWIVSNRTEDGKNALIDTLSGEILSEGYESYVISGDPDNSRYVYAKDKDGNYDIYRIAY